MPTTTVMTPTTASPGETSMQASPAEPASASSTPSSTVPYPHKPAAVHRCGREFFKSLSSRRALLLRDSQHAPSEPAEYRVRLKMQGRSLINVLLIMRKRLITYAIRDSATVQDVQHCALLLDDVKQRWDSSDGFAACLTSVDAPMQHVCSKLFQECTGAGDTGTCICFHPCTSIPPPEGLLEKLKVSSVDMAPDVKEVHDALLVLKRECSSLLDGTHVRLQDVLDLHSRIDASQRAMAAALREGAPGTPSTTSSLDDAAGNASLPKGHAVCAELLHDCHGAWCYNAQHMVVYMVKNILHSGTGGLVVACT